MEADKHNELKELYRQAAEIASVVPENMQPTAFNRAVEQLSGVLSTEMSSGLASTGQAQGISTKDQIKLGHIDKVDNGWRNKFNSTGHPEVLSANTVLDKSLHILLIARNDLGVNQLSPTNIAAILSDKYRIPARANQISDKLGNVVGLLVNRHKVSKGYEYEIMLPGEKHLLGELPLQSARKRMTKRKVKIGGVGKKTNGGARGGRPGQKVMLTHLVDTGFFDKPKKVSDICAHELKTKGYTYKTNELSPYILRFIRESILTREKNTNGQWEYSKI